MEIIKVIKKTKRFAVILNGTPDGGFIVYLVKKGQLNMPISESFPNKFDALARLYELELELR